MGGAAIAEATIELFASYFQETSANYGPLFTVRDYPNTTRVQQLLHSAQRELEEAVKQIYDSYHETNPDGEPEIEALCRRRVAYVTRWSLIFQTNLFVTSQTFAVRRTTTRRTSA